MHRTFKIHQIFHVFLIRKLQALGFSLREIQSLLEAAQDLGANRFQVLCKVLFPLSMPGIVSGVTMVFVPSVSTFIISRMLGGGGNMLIGDLIETQFLGGSYNPYLGSALSLVLMVVMLLIMTVMNAFDEDDMEGMLV